MPVHPTFLLLALGLIAVLVILAARASVAVWRRRSLAAGYRRLVIGGITAATVVLTGILG